MLPITGPLHRGFVSLTTWQFAASLGGVLVLLAIFTMRWVPRRGLTLTQGLLNQANLHLRKSVTHKNYRALRKQCIDMAEVAFQSGYARFALATPNQVLLAPKRADVLVESMVAALAAKGVAVEVQQEISLKLPVGALLFFLAYGRKQQQWKQVKKQGVRSALQYIFTAREHRIELVRKANPPPA
ncbi:hypothetical protein [Ralstonia pickettii]|uniref:hypothetical protein n=1 Tax=Ralstonia pickettii TaxID=329 RepID=UPI0015BAE666|nr:hypothetical protein [Ralstonia pickettii]NWK46418.1 hypothetical protein [Ralstonia pickettii]